MHLTPPLPTIHGTQAPRRGFCFWVRRERAMVTCHSRSAILWRYAHAQYRLERAPYDFFKGLGANRRERA
jgi:hypothetical protein